MIKKILENYKIPGNLKSIKEYNVGNINKTYIIEYDNEGKREKYLVQKINTLVFNNPYILMDNIEKVTSYLKNKMNEYEDKEHKVLSIINKNINILSKEGLIVCETTLNIDYDKYNNLYVYKNKKYGQKYVNILKIK